MEHGSSSTERTFKWSDKNNAFWNSDAWSLSLYRKQKHIIVKTLDYHAGPLIITRDELCELARMMGLHVRKRKRKKKGDKLSG
jgi:hypothetical protein